MEKLMRTGVACLMTFLVVTVASAQAQVNEIRIARGNEDYPPKEMHVGGKLTGLHIELVEAVAARIGMKVVWEELPWPRAQKCAEDGECDAISYISPSPEREKWASFLPGNVLSEISMRFMIHKDNAGKITFNGKVDDFLRDKTVMSLIGYNYGPDIAKAKKYEVKDLATMAGMIADKRYELAVISTDDFNGMKANSSLVLLSPPVWVSRSFLAFSKKAHPASDLANKFQTAYIEYKKSKDYASILNRYNTSPK